MPGCDFLLSFELLREILPFTPVLCRNVHVQDPEVQTSRSRKDMGLNPNCLPSCVPAMRSSFARLRDFLVGGSALYEIYACLRGTSECCMCATEDTDQI